MAAQGGAPAKAKGNTRTGCGCLVFIVVVVVIIIAVASGGGKSKSPEAEAKEYIKEKSVRIHTVSASVEDVEVALGLVIKKGSGASQTEIDELATDAQKAHDGINEVRNELFKTGGKEELSDATLNIQEGANELKNAMGALVAYAGNSNAATLAHLNAEFEKGKEKWDEGVERVWSVAHESGAPKL